MARYLCSYTPKEVWGGEKPSRFDFVYSSNAPQKFSHVGSKRPVPPEIQALELQVNQAISNYNSRLQNISCIPCEVEARLLPD